MKWSIHTGMQILAILLQGLNQIIHAIPDSWRFPIAVAASVIKGILAVLAHFRNPDGGPVTEPYTPKGAT